MGKLPVTIACLGFVAVATYNAWRAWHWTEVPEVLEGREHLIPLQSPAIVFFGSYPLTSVVHAALGAPPNGSGGAVATGVVGAAIALAGGLLAVSTCCFGRPRRLIAPIARDLPRWSPARRRAAGPSR